MIFREGMKQKLRCVLLLWCKTAFRRIWSGTWFCSWGIDWMVVLLVWCDWQVLPPSCQ